MNSKVFFLLYILAFLAFSQLALVSCRKSMINHDLDGFTVDLIHRDSPLSPYYNPLTTPSQRLRDACQRSFSRASFFMNHAIQSDIIPDEGEYLMRIAIGTPPRETFAVADTGSDLTWVQCKPCTHCYKQILPLFDARKSSTYKIIGCHSKECELASRPYCVRKNVCEYEVHYGDGSFSVGDIASETFTFASSTSKTKNISIPHVVFGCGHHNDGTFHNRTAGIVGLGGSKISIIKQLDKQIQGKFSYCLVQNDDLTPPYHPPNTSSKINFGPKSVIRGPNVVTTPIFRKNTDTFYFLNLESISIGGKKLEYKSSRLMNPSAADEDLGNILIDSGTTLTYFPRDFYDKFESTLLKMIKGTRKEGPMEELSICYETKSVEYFPKIVFHFMYGDIELSHINAFVKIEDLSCLTIVAGSNADFGIYGNLAQMNFLIGYDLVNHKLSFLPTNCTKH